MDRGDGALGQVVAPGPAHDIGDHQGREGPEDPGANPVEQLDTDQLEAVIGEGVKHRPDRQDGEPGEKQGLPSPTVGSVPNQEPYGQHYDLHSDEAGEHHRRRYLSMSSR